MNPDLNLIGCVIAFCAGLFAGVRTYMQWAGLVTTRFSTTLWLLLSIFFLNQSVYLFLEYRGYYHAAYTTFTIAINVVTCVFSVYEFFTRRAKAN